MQHSNVKMARKPGKKETENPVGCTGEGKRLKGNIRQGKTETVFEFYGDEIRWVRV